MFDQMAGLHGLIPTLLGLPLSNRQDPKTGAARTVRAFQEMVVMLRRNVVPKPCYLLAKSVRDGISFVGPYITANLNFLTMNREGYNRTTGERQELTAHLLTGLYVDLSAVVCMVRAVIECLETSLDILRSESLLANCRCPGSRSLAMLPLTACQAVLFWGARDSKFCAIFWPAQNTT